MSVLGNIIFKDLKVKSFDPSGALLVRGIASSNLRRQLKRLKDMFLIEKINNLYRINENEDLDVLFEEKLEKYYLNSIVERVKDYFKAVK